MLKINLGVYKKLLNLMFKDNYETLKTMTNSTRAVLANIIRIRNVEIERYFYQNFKKNFNEEKNNYFCKAGHVLLGAAIFSFAEDKITDEEIEEHFQEFIGSSLEETKNTLKDNSLEESFCDKFSTGKKSSLFNKSMFGVVTRLLLDDHHVTKKMNDVNKKLCPENPVNFIDSTWTQMINTESVKLWRRPMKANEVLFEYRLCGSFSDISADDFFFVQTDIEYRKTWDDLVVDLRIVSKDDKTGTETIRWVTHYPYPMNDREYIFKRRSIHFDSNESAIIVSKAVDSSSAAFNNQYSRNVKVQDYKSIMYIQSHNKFNEPGIDYFLIYYDDPKTNFPNAAVNWMSTSGIPSFMDKVHKAARCLKYDRSVREGAEIVNDDTMSHGSSTTLSPARSTSYNDSFRSYFSTVLLSIDNSLGALTADNDIYDVDKSQ